ncbi:MAG TPA: HEAT repeat domain-containing protein [Planctomycetota bacterium]|nr:HEAT repeat domain-containing protein [Planctomycetota bacterium]
MALALGVAALALALLGSAAAQDGVIPSVGKGDKKKPEKPNVFDPPGGGGQYSGPGDATGPGGDGGGGGGGGTGPGSGGDGGGQAPPGIVNGVGPAAGAPGVGATSAPARGRPMGLASLPPGSAASTLSSNFVPDSWDQWWETNKFDFIELRRVQDATPTGGRSGNSTGEAAATHELRMAGVRAHVRDDVLPVLRELTHSSDDAVRSAAFVALGKLHDGESLDLISVGLSDGNADVRRSAMLSMGVLGSGRGTWMLMHVADDSKNGRTLVNDSAVSVDERGTALLTAALRGDASCEQVVLQVLADRQGSGTELLALAADAAGLLGSTDAIRPLLEIAFAQDLPEHVRSAATSALGRIGDPSVTPALIELLDLGQEPRRAATLALGLVAHPGATKVIERLTTLLEKDSDAPTRHFAAVSLGRIGGPAARTALQAALVKSKADMQPWVALGLGLVERRDPDGTVAPLLIERLEKESSSDARGALLIALGLTRDERAVPALEHFLTGSSSELAGHAAMALGMSGRATAMQPLRDTLARSGDPLVLRQAAFALGVLGDSASMSALLDLIRGTSNPFVASFASIGIAFMGDASAVGPLMDIIRSHGPTGVTTSWAVAAVGQLFDVDRRPALSRLAAGDNYLVRPTAVTGLLDLGY